MTNIAMELSKLKTALSNVHSQLKMEKISSLENDNRVKSLEDLVIKIGYDPTNVKVVEDIIKKKNTDITALRKQLKLPSTEDPQTKEVAESEQHKEEKIKLIIEQNVKIKTMEEKIEKFLKEKEKFTQLDIAPITVIPITVSKTIGESTSATVEYPSTAGDLNKFLQELTHQKQENERLHKKFKNLEAQKIKNDTLYVEEMKNTHRLNRRIEELQSESLMAQTLAQSKENIWVDIGQSITKVWPSIQIIF